MKIKSQLFAGSCSIVFAMLFQVASTQAADATNPTPPASGGIETVVVTAQKRSEDVQKVPIALTVLSADALAQKGVTSLKDLANLTPNIAVSSTFGNTNPQITMRGVGSASFNQTTESTTALYLDEFVLNPQSSKLGQLFDLERVEVLRGPQGTLYGKNSTGGAINFVSRKPDGTYELDGTATIARFGEYDIEAGAQAPITDDLSARVAVERRYRDGYGFDLNTLKTTNDIDDWAGRFLLRYQDNGLDATLKIFADSSYQQGNYGTPTGIEATFMPNPGKPIPGNANPITGYIPPTNIDDTWGNPQYSNVDNRGVTLNATQELGDLTLTSVTGYLFSKSNIKSDVDSSPFLLAETNPYEASANEVSQELRLSSAADETFTWIAGVSFIQQSISYYNDNIFTVFGIPSLSWTGKDSQTSYAGFVDGTYHITDALSLIGGVRVTHDQKHWHEQSAFSFVGPYNVSDSHSWTDPSYRVGLNYQITPETMVYVSYNHGYRSGAYDSGLKTSPSQFTPVSPEYVDSYEAGVKTTLFDNHLQFSADFYYQQLLNQQQVLPNSHGLCCAVINAGDSYVYGGELEGTALVTDNFDINFSGSLTSSAYTRFTSNGVSYKGVSLANVPGYQLRLAPEYRIPFQDGQLFVAPEFTFTGGSRLDVIPNNYRQDLQKAYSLINLQVGWRAPDDKYTIYAWVKNATDERYRNYYVAIPVYGFAFQIYSEPRIYGLSVGVHL